MIYVFLNSLKISYLVLFIFMLMTSYTPLPKHLHQYVVPQNYDEYTAQNQAVWRYVMQMNIDYLPTVAHQSYIEGLKKTGISINSIPQMEGMNRILKNIGWSAVSVDGFIPPHAFMEFQAFNVLVIASEIRTIDHLLYTPAPDIIHEAAGHAPIIANPEYAEYLRRFGQVGSKAIVSPKDSEMYEAIRKLSILKENPHATKNDIAQAEEQLQEVQQSAGELSEMAQIRNLHWWTVEYGLIGELTNPKIYGAGLLSSIGESKSCLKPNVPKIPYTVEAAQVNFDITQPQPQLFVTPDFAHLSLVLEEYANTMALRSGGLKGIQKLINSKTIGTIELSTGIQISGIFDRVITDDEDLSPIYVQTAHPTALAIRDKELIGHGTTYHRDGFGCPIGKLKGINIPIENMSPRDLAAYHIYEGKKTTLEFEGGIVVSGEVITGTRDLKGVIVLISFINCTVTYKDQTLFQPSWGVYDMAVGKEVISAYAGPADASSFHNLKEVSTTTTQKIKYTESELALHRLYKKVSELREINQITPLQIMEIFDVLKTSFKNEWLLALELYELAVKNQHTIQKQLRTYLQQLQHNTPHHILIENGVKMIQKNHQV